MKENKIICYAKSLYHKKVLAEAASKHPMCNSLSGYVAIWLSLATKFIKDGVGPEHIMVHYSKLLKILKEKDK